MCGVTGSVTDGKSVNRTTKRSTVTAWIAGALRPREIQGIQPSFGTCLVVTRAEQVTDMPLDAALACPISSPSLCPALRSGSADAVGATPTTVVPMVTARRGPTGTGDKTSPRTASQPPTGEIERSSVRWYVASHNPGAHTHASYALAAAGFPTYTPYVDVQHPSQVRSEPCFPGYLLVSWADGADWSPVVRTPGIRRVLGMDMTRPTPLRQGVVEALIASADERKIVLDPRPFLHAAGVDLRVLGGPFLNSVGRCLWSKRDRVGLLLDVLGAPRLVVVATSDVKRA